MKLPQFTVRDLFWLVLVAALACAWWVDRQALLKQTGVLSTRMAGLIEEINRLEIEALQRQIQRAQSGWPGTAPDQTGP